MGKPALQQYACRHILQYHWRGVDTWRTLLILHSLTLKCYLSALNRNPLASSLEFDLRSPQWSKLHLLQQYDEIFKLYSIGIIPRVVP